MSASPMQRGHPRVVPVVGVFSDRVVGVDPVTQRMLLLAESVAKSDSTVLLTGESGAGKEIVARHIHDRSPRCQGPFIAINCAAISPNLLESELFGHERGAFSGAVRRHLGVFERANGGTLLLDEVSEIPPDMQVKLLRVLQERSLLRVGGSAPVDLDIRVIATSNRDLKQCVADGNFRLDLYYRLNVFPLRVPALRERSADIVPLTLYALGRFAAQVGCPVEGVSLDALAYLEAHDFPGNVRELVNILERAVILACGGPTIELEHIILEPEVSPLRPQLVTLPCEPFDDEYDAPDDEHHPGVPFQAGIDTLTEVKKRVILSTLEHYDGNRTRTAEALGVSLRTIRNHLRKYRERGIRVPE